MKYVDENYQTIPFPFKEIEVPSFENQFQWSIEQLLGYLNTWSAVQHYIRSNSVNPVDLVKSDLEQLWGDRGREVVFPLLLRIGKKL